MPGLRVLFLGGTGIISSACSWLAVERGIDLFLLNRGQSTDRPLPPEATVLRGDARDPATVREALGTREFDAREIVAWHDEDGSRQRIDAGVDALSDKLAQAWRPGG
jgi:uncharacterized protein YbjT (DUF2867 family)